MPANRTTPLFPALDGLRAVAVLGVLGAHTAVPGMRGGFLGVDVFFVLSGFLITSLLLDERCSSGRLNLLGFWARRARRLLPAALVMVSVVVLLRQWFMPDAAADLRMDALRATLWSGNWHWALGGTNYFAQGGTPSPLQHTWSLAVEEQFYLLWPLLLLLTWRAAPTASSVRRRTLFVAVGTVATSAVLTWWLTGSEPLGRTYFGTDTRAQELAAGAIQAVVLMPTWRWASERRRARRSPQAQGRAAWLLAAGGLAGLIVLGHSATGSMHEFHSGSMLVVAALSASLIAGVVLDPRTPVARALATRPMRLLGRMSYGVYLWHWPAFELVDGARTHLAPAPLAALRVALALGLGALSLVLIELPARRLPRLANRRVLQIAALAVCGAATFAACSASPTAPSASTSGSAPDSPPQSSSASTSRSPSVQRSSIPPRRRHGTQVVDVFGDSIGWTLDHYLPATPGYRFVDRTVLGCGIVRGGPYRYFGQEYSAAQRKCDGWPRSWLRWVRRDRPDAVLLVVGRWETMDRVYRGTWTHVGNAAFDNYLGTLLAQAIRELGSTGAHVFVTTEPYNRRGEQANGQLYPEDNPARVDAWNSIVRRIVGSRAGTMLLDLNKKLCPGGVFTFTVHGIQVRSDGVHLTPAGVHWLTPWLLHGLARG